MIDLHLHTIFSDGEIDNLSPIADECNIISITDHNTIQGFKFFSKDFTSKKIILGSEITVEGAPDYLLYFPDTPFDLQLENELQNIRLEEERIIRYCYFKLGYTHWEEDIARAYPPKQKIKNARTRELAAIIHLYNTGLKYDEGNFEPDDLEIARQKRREYSAHIGNFIPTNIAFDIAKKFHGKIVLAHPIRTAVKRCAKNHFDISVIKQCLSNLINEYVNRGGKTVEWEYLTTNYLNKYGLTFGNVKCLRRTIFQHISEFSLKLTIGSDSHILYDYQNVATWLKENEETFGEYLADWIGQ